MHIHRILFESFDANLYTKIFFDEETNGFVVAHKAHGHFEFAANKAIALLLIKHGYRVVLLENQQNVVSADATLNDDIWEFKTVAKTVSMSNSVQRNITRGKHQAPNVLIFIAQVYKTKEVTKGIYNAIKFDEKRLVNKIGVLFQNGDLKILTRSEVLNGTFVNQFQED